MVTRLYPREKQMMISLISEDSLFESHNNEIIQMSSVKLDKKNIRNSFLSIKNFIKRTLTDLVTQR